MRSLEVNFENIQNLNAVPLGLSVDSAISKKAWLAAILINKVSLSADFWPHGKLTQNYGVFNKKQGTYPMTPLVMKNISGLIRP